MDSKPSTAAAAGLMLCHDCRKLCPKTHPPKGFDAICPRCGSVLHSRKPNSIHRTWALVITAFILYIPANLYPIMTVVHLGHGSPATIMEGVKLLFAEGMVGIALVVFFASVAVPMMKLFGLVLLLLAVQFRWKIRPREQTRLYRAVECIGRWSMLDIFVIAILVALVKLGSVAEITAGPAATSFGAVVVVTMFAAESFDPRLIWDTHEEMQND